MELSQIGYDVPQLSDLYNIAPSLSDDRREVLSRIAKLEREGRFDVDVENDPPTLPLDHTKVDYLGEKFFSKIKTAIANKLGYSYFSRLIKKGEVIIESVHGVENLSALDGGAVVTCNHFAAYDNFIAYKALEDFLPRGKLYKIVREGNYTSASGLFGFLFRNCNTLPLASDARGSMALMKAVGYLLERGDSVLIYPEQAMWWNYRKPRPFKSGGFIMAFKANVPVVPVFVTMQDSERLARNGYPVQKHTVHIMPPVFPQKGLAQKAGSEKMRKQTFELYKNKYEEIYGEEYSLCFSTAQ